MRDRRPLSLANTDSPCGVGANIFHAANDNRFGVLSCYDTLPSSLCELRWTGNRLQYSATGTSGAVPSTCTSSGTNIVDKTLVGACPRALRSKDPGNALGNPPVSASPRRRTSISSKSDVGTYTYGSGTTLPHAVTSVTGSYLGLTNPVLGGACPPAAQSADRRDAIPAFAGTNMTCTSTAANCTGTVGRQVAYTSFNMTASVTQGTTLLCLAYDTEHARITQTATTTSNSCASPGTSAVTTTYLNDPTSGAIEEAVSQPGMALVWRDYVQADGHIVALRTTTYTGSGTRWGAADWGSFNWSATTTSVSVLYFTLDHLGSIAVVTNASGTVVERDSYDAWGKRRNANGTDVSTCSITSATTRGFTNQEMMDAVCLVNLNARLYDPILGRFLAADPVIGTPFVPQELNRYTYVLDDPLSLTDPSGLCFLGCFWKSPIFIAIVGIAVAILVPEALFGFENGVFAAAAAGNLSAIADFAVGGALAGGITAGLGGGNILKGALLGGITGAAFAGLVPAVGGDLGNALAGVGIGLHTANIIGDSIAAGLIGGISSAAGGGRFASGFLAAGIGSLAGPIVGAPGQGISPQGLVVGAILGGTASVLGGGKFANGAITGAFAYAVETCAEGGCDIENESMNGQPPSGTGWNAKFNGGTLPYLHYDDGVLVGTATVFCGEGIDCTAVIQELGQVNGTYANGYGININFVQTNQVYGANITVNFDSDPTSVCGVDAAACTLGRALIYVESGQQNAANIFDHEFGHLLGFSDALNPNSVMHWQLPLTTGQFSQSEATMLINAYNH